MLLPTESAPILIGISGPSCSGKTTLSRSLKLILPSAYVLHEDDFYKTDSAIPVKDGVQDWDCADSIDLPQFSNILRKFKNTGLIDTKYAHKGDEGIEPFEQKELQSIIASYRSILSDIIKQHHSTRKIAIIEGFLLFSEEMRDIRNMLDIKIFLQLDLQTIKERRQARKGYVTIEGFWEDPPDYVEDIVWPNYVKDHSFLFEDGNVNRAVNHEASGQLGISTAPKRCMTDMKALVTWACELLAMKLVNNGN